MKKGKRSERPNCFRKINTQTGKLNEKRTKPQQIQIGTNLTEPHKQAVSTCNTEIIKTIPMIRIHKSLNPSCLHLHKKRGEEEKRKCVPV